MTVPFARLIAAALLVLTCALAGCGRKGGLDAPPSANAVPTAAETTADGTPSPYGTAPGARDVNQDAGSLFTSAASGKVIAPRGPKKRIILDPILD